MRSMNWRKKLEEKNYFMMKRRLRNTMLFFLWVLWQSGPNPVIFLQGLIRIRLISIRFHSTECNISPAKLTGRGGKGGCIHLSINPFVKECSPAISKTSASTSCSPKLKFNLFLISQNISEHLYGFFFFKDYFKSGLGL